MAPAIKIKTLDKITIIPIPNKQSHEFNLYPGVGFFTASNYEDDRGVKTSTFSGVQPMIQFKGIYSSDLFGSVSVDLMTKKIINSQFSFPINLDYRMQFVPKWNFTDTFRFALSLSTLKHSYVGKSSTVEVPYELTSHFIGLGVVVPHDHFWYELYVEKAFSGEAKSSELTQKTTNGIRIDTEVVYPIYKEWRILPGINYYYVKNSSTNYAFSVLESRLVFAREFEF